MKAIVPISILLLTSIHCWGQTPGNDSTELKTAPWFVEKFKVTAGFFVPVSNTNIQVNAKGGATGSEIDFESDLGFNSSQVTFLANFQWRVGRRSRINLNYYNIPRNSTYTLQKDITFNDKIYSVSASVNSYFNTSIYQASYGYAILAKPDFELGVLIGTHLVGGEAGISLNNAGGSVSDNSDFGFTAPFPDLGIWGGYAFSNRFGVNFEMSYLPFSTSDISGRIVAYNFVFMYRAAKKLDVSLGYSGLNFRLDIYKTNVDGHLKWSYNGPSLGVTYSFGKKPWR